MPTLIALEKAKTDYYHEVIEIIQNYDPLDKVSFAAIIKCSLEQGIHQGEIAKLFDVNESTISRWKNGQSQPLRIIRKQVATEIANLLKTRADLAAYR